MMFQDTSTEVNVSTQGGKKASRMIDNIASKPTDNGILKTLESAGSAARQYNATQSTLEATQAKQDYLKLMMSPEYRDGSSSNRAEALESIYKNNSANKSQAYTDAFTTYSSGQYMQEYDKREIEVDNSYYEQAGASYTAYMDADSDIQHPAWKEGYDEDMRYMTNKEAGRTPADFVEAYQTLRPRLDKVVIGTGIVKDLYGEMAFNISMAQTPEELEEALSNNEEMKQPFKSPFFLENKSKQGLTELAKLDTKISNIITVKKKEFKANANTRIALNNDKDNPSPTKRYLNEPVYEDYVIGKEDKAVQTYNDDMHKYAIMEEARQKSYVYDPDVHIDWTTESDETKEVYQEALDYRLQSQLENGDLTDAASTITSNGSVDTKRLNNTRQSIKSGLNSENAGQVYGQLMRMSAKNGASFNVLFPDTRERAKLIALGPLNQVRGESLEETWKYIQSSPELMPDKSRTRAEIKELSTLIHDSNTPTEMKAEMQSMYNTMQSYGVEHSDIMDGIKKYTESKPYEVNLNNYTENEQDIMKYAIGAFKKSEDSTMYEDPLTGMLFEQDLYGNKTNLIDKKGLYNYANKMSTIKQYNREYATSQFLEKQAGRFAETVGDVTTYQLDKMESFGKNAFNYGSYINYLYMTKVDTEGNIIERPDWEAPYDVDTVEDIVAMIQEKEGGTVEENFNQAGEMLENLEQLYPDLGKEPIQTLRQVLMPSSFSESSSNVPNELKIQLDYVNNTEQKSKNNILSNITPKDNTSDDLISSVFNAEAGYSTDTQDTGNYYKGEFIGTNHGISAAVLAEELGRTPTVEDMKNLTKEEATSIYNKNYVDKYGVNYLPTELREIYLHSVVNSGRGGSKTLQGLLGVQQTGFVGDETKAAMKNASFSKKEFKDALLKRYKTFKTWEEHGDGWTTRFEKLAK